MTKKLYFVDSDPEIFVWDTATNQMSEKILLSVNSYDDVADLEVASGHIYVSSTAGITVINLHTEKEVTTINMDHTNSIAVDETNNWLYVENDYDNKLDKYLIDADYTLPHLQSSSMIINSDIELTVDGSKVAVLEYSSSEYFLKVYDAHQLDQLLGEWTTENISNIGLSPDGLVLFVTTKKDVVHVIDMETYSEIGRYSYSNGRHSEVITNSDGSVVITSGSSGSSYSDVFSIFYFDNIYQ